MASAKMPALGEISAKLSDPNTDPGTDDDTYGAAVDELAEVVGVADVDAFREAFKAAVMSCK